MSAIRIQAFGPLQIWLDEELLPDKVWPTQKSRQLFEILLINHGRAVPADRLLEYLWPELDVKKARNSLWVSVSHARRVLEPDLPPRTVSKFIVKKGDGYQFQPHQDCWFDLVLFQEAIAQARAVAGTAEAIDSLQQAVDLFRTGLLAHDPYAEWTIQPRRRLQEDFIKAALELASALGYQGEFRRSVDLCRRCLGFDDSRESIYRALMLYLYCMGERSEALQVYEMARQKLLEEVGVEPTTKTRLLQQQIQKHQVIGVDIAREYPRQDDTRSAMLLLSQMPLVGRTEELSRLIDLSRQLLNGIGGVGLVTGESGIGKSRLLQEATRFARQDALLTLTVSCYQIEQNLLYGPLIDLVRHIHQAQPELVAALATVWQLELAALIPEAIQLSRTVPGHYEDASEAQQGRLFQAVKHYLLLAAGQSGLVITIEDIHWADEGTLLFLHYLGSRINDSGLLLLLSYRQEGRAIDPQLANFLHHMQRLPTTTTIYLKRLTKGDLNALLLTQSLIPDGLADWLYEETLGNPYFVVSILQSFVEQQLVAEEAAWQLPPGVALPNSIRESLRARLRPLPTRERVILEWIAVYGRPIDFVTLKVISGQPDDALLEIVDHLLQRNFLLEGADGLAFSHHKIAEFLYDELSATRRIISHQKIGHTLSTISEDAPALLAYHFVRAGDTGLAISFWLKAGQAALRSYALQLAVTHFKDVLELAEDSTARLDGYIGLGHALTLLDDVDGATMALQTGTHLAEELGDERRRAELAFRSAQLYSRQHPADAAEIEIRRALLLAQEVPDETLIARLLLLLSVVQSSSGLLETALDSVMEARAASREKKDGRLEAQALNEMGFIYAQMGDFTKAIDVVQEALSIEATAPDRGISTYSWNILGRACGGSGRYQQALDAFAECRKQADEIDDRFFLAQVPNMLGWLYRELYDLEKAEQCDQESVALAVRYGKSPIEISARLNLCLDWLGMGRTHDARAALLQIERWIETGQFGFHQWRWRLRLLHIWGVYHLQTRQPERTLAQSASLWEMAQAVNARKYLCLAQQLRGDALIALMQLDDALPALTHAVELAESIAYRPVMWEASLQMHHLQPAASREVVARAIDLAQQTAAQLSDPDLQLTFLNAPPIQALLAAANSPTQ